MYTNRNTRPQLECSENLYKDNIFNELKFVDRITDSEAKMLARVHGNNRPDNLDEYDIYPGTDL